MTEPANDTRWKVVDHERRIANLERFDIAVIVNKIETLQKRVDGMTRAMWATSGSLLIAALTIALTLR